MKLQILSDLHIEFTPFEMVDMDVDVVILAGDIHLGMKGFAWAREQIPAKPVLYVLGNHEFYNEATPRLYDKLQEASKGTNIHVLENRSITLDGVRFIGATLWSDFKLLGNQDVAIAFAKMMMNDYKRIRISPEYRKIEPSFTVVWHRHSRNLIQGEIEKRGADKMVVITHHAPSRRSIPAKNSDHPINAAFASDMDEFVASSGVDLWVHGHIHAACDYMLGNTQVICNPRGYPGEPNTGFNPAQTVEI